MALITYLTRILFDFGAVAQLGEELAALGVRRPLVATDRGVVAAGLAERVTDALPAGMAAVVYDGTPANPTEAAVREATALYRDGGCDGVVAIGGGSAIDLGKGVRLAATHDGPLAHYAAIEGGAPRIRRDVAPMVAIPTTAGTGSEVGRGTVLVLDDGRKLGILSPHLIPSVAICDPELTLGLPPAVTAGTGMDAIAHCIETFLAPAVNPPADAIALDGLARAAGHIERAVADGSDREARWQMMMAAMEGAMAFQKGLGAVHALSHPLGSLTEPRLHHGTLNAVLLPAVMRFNAPAVGDKLHRIGGALDLMPGGDPATAIAELTHRLGLPTTLSAMGVPEAVREPMAEAATRDHCTATNPRPATAADYRALLEAAW